MFIILWLIYMCIYVLRWVSSILIVQILFVFCAEMTWFFGSVWYWWFSTNIGGVTIIYCRLFTTYCFCCPYILIFIIFTILVDNINISRSLFIYFCFYAVLSETLILLSNILSNTIHILLSSTWSFFLLNTVVFSILCGINAAHFISLY